MRYEVRAKCRSNRLVLCLARRAGCSENQIDCSRVADGIRMIFGRSMWGVVGAINIAQCVRKEV